MKLQTLQKKIIYGYTLIQLMQVVTAMIPEMKWITKGWDRADSSSNQSPQMDVYTNGFKCLFYTQTRYIETSI